MLVLCRIQFQEGDEETVSSAPQGGSSGDPHGAAMQQPRLAPPGAEVLMTSIRKVRPSDADDGLEGGPEDNMESPVLAGHVALHGSSDNPISNDNNAAV